MLSPQWIHAVSMCSDGHVASRVPIVCNVQVLLALSRLVNALGMDSPASYGLLIPILQNCTATNQVSVILANVQQHMLPD